MTKHRVARQARGHRGVRFLEVRGYLVARWLDPLTGRQVQQSMAALGLSSEQARRVWAQGKAKELQDVRRAAAEGVTTPRRCGVEQSVAEYLETVEHESTRRNRVSVLRRFVDWASALGVDSLADLTGPRVMLWRDFVSTRLKATLAASSRNRHLAEVGVFLRWARVRGMLPLCNLEHIAAATRKVPLPVEAIDFLRPPQLRALLGAVLEYDGQSQQLRRIAPFVLALVTSGARFEEIAGLRWDEVQSDGIHLPATRTKTRRARVIGFTESPSLGRLLEVMRAKASGPFVFDDMPYMTWKYAQKRLARFGAPRCTPHMLRRSAGTIMTNSPAIYGAASAWASAKRLGHSVTVAERAYAGVLRDLPADARTLEAAAGIEDLAQAIVDAEAAR
ncbi:MAG: tyrosine-type recombinase/integrase [Planctomycetota bacterium]|jgi:integrase